MRRLVQQLITVSALSSMAIASFPAENMPSSADSAAYKKSHKSDKADAVKPATHIDSENSPAVMVDTSLAVTVVRAPIAKVDAPTAFVSRQSVVEAGAPSPVPSAAIAGPETPVGPLINGRGHAVTPDSAQPVQAAQASIPVPTSSPASASGPGNTAPAPQTREQRLALVIGNSAYKFAPLANPANDAHAMALRLRQLGFTVIEKLNAGREDMRNSVRDFGNQLANGGVGMFYYAGHGIQFKNTNYLIPVDADIQSQTDLVDKAYDVDEVLEKMDSAKNRLNMVVLDACRNNPIPAISRSAGRGLAPINQGQAPRGTLIAYATSPGATASDGNGKNGLYTEQLLAALSEPGLKLEEVFKRVRQRVLEISEGQQLTWDSSSVVGDFYFNPVTPEQMAGSPNLLASAGAMTGIGNVTPISIQRELAPVLVARKIFESYQLTADLSLIGPPLYSRVSNVSHFAVAVGQDKTLKVWDARNGKVVLSFPDFGTPAPTPDGRFVAGLTGGGKVNVFDTDSPREGGRGPRTVSGLGGNVRLASVSPDGKQLLVYARDGFSLIDLVSGSPNLKKLGEVDGEPHYLFSPTSTRLVVWGSKQDNLFLWDTRAGNQVARLGKHWKPVSYAKFSDDGHFLLTSAENDHTSVWRSEDGENLGDLNVGDGGPAVFQAVFINNDQQILASTARSTGDHPHPGQTGFWDVSNGRMLASIPQSGNVLTFRLSPDHQKLFVPGDDKSLRIVDTVSKSVQSTLSDLEFIDVSPDGRRFLAKDSNNIRIYDTRSFAVAGRVIDQSTAFVGGGKSKLFASTAADGSLKLWDFEHGDAIASLKGHLDSVVRVDFSADGRELVSFGGDRSVKLWGMPDVENIAQLSKDQFETTADYQKRVENWASPYSTLVSLGEYNPDEQKYTVKIGDVAVTVPMPLEEAKQLRGQRQAILTGSLKYFDLEQLRLDDARLIRLPD